MKIIVTVILISFFLVQQGCNSEKSNMAVENDNELIIKTAISDFSESSSLYQKNKVFSISKEPILKSVKTKDPKNKNYSLINGLPYQNLIHVKFTSNPPLLSGDIKSKIGNKSMDIPSRYLEKNGKLFFWWDSEYEFTEETYNVYKSYEIIKNDSEIDKTKDAKLKIQHYYFCPDNNKKFMRLDLDEDLNSKRDPILDCID